MNLLEFEGKHLLRAAGLRVPQGYVAASIEDVALLAPKLPGTVIVLKAQVPAGHRGQQGGVLFAPKRHAVDAALNIWNKSFGGFVCREILLEEKLDVRAEYYAAAMVDRSTRELVAIYSTQGGMDIEEVARTRPDQVRRLRRTELLGLDVPHRRDIHATLAALVALLEAHDALLAEVNPLVATPSGVVAADAKIVIDDNALFRRPEFAGHHEQEFTAIEAQAHRYHLPYVELDGSVGVIGCGAGLVMSSLDLLEHFGTRAANFLDIGGGASMEVMEQALELVLLNPRVKGLFINIFGGLTRCDEIATGILDYRARRGVAVPIVVRMTGTNQDEGKARLLAGGIQSLDSMEDCARHIAELVCAPGAP